MSKIRVYELAKELNLTNKALMEKLTGLNITVASHMSSLDDDAAQRVKAVLFGKKEATVEEKRVKSTVIRRRKKVTEVPAEEAPAAEAPAEPPAVPAEPAASVVEAVEAVEAIAPAPESPASAETEDAVPEELPAHAAAEPADAAATAAVPVVTEKLRKGEKIVKKVKRDEPARIIKLPVAPVERTAEPPRVRPKLVEPRGPKVAGCPGRDRPAGTGCRRPG